MSLINASLQQNDSRYLTDVLIRQTNLTNIWIHSFCWDRRWVVGRRSLRGSSSLRRFTWLRIEACPTGRLRRTWLAYVAVARLGEEVRCPPRPTARRSRSNWRSRGSSTKLPSRRSETF